MIFLCFMYFIQYREWQKTFQGSQGNEWFMLFIKMSKWYKCQIHKCYIFSGIKVEDEDRKYVNYVLTDIFIMFALISLYWGNHGRLVISILSSLASVFDLEGIGVMTSMISYDTYDSATVDSCCFILFQDYLAQNSETKFQTANCLVRSLIFIHKHGDRSLLY